MDQKIYPNMKECHNDEYQSQYKTYFSRSFQYKQGTMINKINHLPDIIVNRLCRTTNEQRNQGLLSEEGYQKSGRMLIFIDIAGL